MAIYCVLAGAYSLWNPLFEAGDEYLHYPVVRSLADGAGLPVQPENPPTYGYEQEGSQPPLYYGLAALLTAPIETGPPGPGYAPNPHAIVGSPHALGNKNIALAAPHPEGADWGNVLAAHLARLLSVAFGALAVAATYLLTRQLSPQVPAVALLATAWVAFLPEFLFLSASINNDIAGIALATSALVAINHAAAQPSSSRRWLLVGLLCGLAALAKLNAAGVAGLALVAIVWRLRESPDRRWAGPALASVILLPAVIAGWWYVRNLALYGDPTGLAAMLDIVQRRSLGPSELAAELSSIRYSFWGVFGGFNVPLPEWLYWLYDGLAVAAVGGLISGGVRARGNSLRRHDWLPITLSLLWLAFTVVSLIRWTQSTMGSQGRLLFPALAVLAFLFATGWSVLARRPWRRPVFGTLGVVLLAGGILAPLFAILPAYAEPRRYATEAAAPAFQPSPAIFGDSVELLGYRLGRPDGSLAEAVAGNPLAVTLYWRAREPLPENWSAFVHLLDRQNRLLAQSNSYPGAGAYPFSRFRTGEIVEDIAYFEIDQNSPAPTLARLEAGLYRYPSLERLPVRGERALPHGSVYLDDVAVAPPREPSPLDHPAGLRFGDSFTLLDYDILPPVLPADGGELALDLRWRAEQKPAADYTVFVHLVDKAGRVVAQTDSEPRQGTYPTTVWQPGEIVPDHQQISVPPKLPPGDYIVRVGLYQRQTSERLPVPDAPDNAPALATVTLGGP